MKESKENASVPVFVDDIKNYKDFKFTRLSYFYLDLSTPEEFSIEINDEKLPVAVIDFEGIIISGIRENFYFDTPQIIEDLFDFIYDETPFNVSSGYIWLPNSLIKKYVSEKIDSKSVLRITMDLFIEASKKLLMPEQINLNDLSQKEQLIYYSRKEAFAFSEWTDLTLDAIKKSYHQNTANNLRNRT